MLFVWDDSQVLYNLASYAAGSSDPFTKHIQSPVSSNASLNSLFPFQHSLIHCFIFFPRHFPLPTLFSQTCHAPFRSVRNT
jgi:hypothetical protein